MKILNFGSLNIDIVYRVPHIVMPGETLASTNLSTHAGGKGANQSAALAKAGAEVFHAGKIGTDGLWLLDKLKSFGVNIDLVKVEDCKTGNALIQVSDDGENSIVLYGGGNQEITENDIFSILENFGEGDILLLQNEINLIPEIIDLAYEKKMIIYFNPAPFNKQILEYPLDKIDVFIVNETEGSDLSNGTEDPDEIVDILTSDYRGKEIILTLGEKGVIYGKDKRRINAEAVKVKAVDTTSAGDTFIGYYITEILKGNNVKQALNTACSASSKTVLKAGAMESIPVHTEL